MHVDERYLNTCPVGCNAALEETEYLLPEGALLRCTGCGQLINQCTEERYLQSMQEFNDPRGTLPEEGLEQRRRFRRSKMFLDQITKLLARSPDEIRLLDVGCSSGAFLEAAARLGFLAEGVEPAARAAATAQAAGLKVYTGLLHEAAYQYRQFDAITLFEVIEHLKEPLPLLHECRRILRPGGILLIGTGNAASWSAAALGAHWEYFDISKHGGHISFYTPTTLAKLTGQAGFEVASIKTRSVRFLDRSNNVEPIYILAKIGAELVNPLAKMLGKGSDMAL